jgi:hypothetical protein
MIVAVSIMRMVEPAFDEIVNMISMRDRLMPTLWPMDMVRGMSLRSMIASVRMRLVHFDYVFIGVTIMHVMKMAIMQVISMSLMFDREMSATRAVLMGMIRMLDASCHRNLSFLNNHTIPHTAQAGSTRIAGH